MSTAGCVLSYFSPVQTINEPINADNDSNFQC